MELVKFALKYNLDKYTFYHIIVSINHNILNSFYLLSVG